MVVAGYSAYPRNPNFRILREIADEIDATFMVDMAHFAGLVAGGVLTGDLDPVPHAHVVTSTTHKSLRGPARRHRAVHHRVRRVRRQGLPAVLGGPMPHVMAAKAVALAEARQPEFAGYAAPHRRERRRAGRRADAPRTSVSSPAAPRTTGAARRARRASASPGARPSRRWSSRGRHQPQLDPGDPNGAWYTSGVRLGTPALTTLGLGTDELDEVAGIIVTSCARPPASTKSGTSKARYQLSEDIADAARRRAADLLNCNSSYPMA